MFEIFTEGFTLLNFLSILAFFTTVGLFFCGIPICRQIWKRKDTKEISGAPFLMGVLGGTLWMIYGTLKDDQTVKVVTACQVVLYTSYSIFYWFMSKSKLWISLKIAALVTVCVTMLLLVHFFGMHIYHPLGAVCVTLNAMDFAAPLAGLKVVIRRRATSTLPLPLCIANFMVSTEWFLYGLLKHDWYLITPNGIGSFLAVIQLILFVVLPRKPGQRSPIVRLARFVIKRESDAEEIEAPIPVVPELDENEKKISRAQRFSARVKSNVSSVAEGLENVISKVHAHEQFAYKHEEDDETLSDTNTVESGKTSVVSKNELPMLHILKVPSSSKLRQSMVVKSEQKKDSALSRSMSSPDLTENKV